MEKIMALLNELKNEVLNNNKSRVIYEQEQEIYELCKKLKQIRQEKNFTQKDIASITGMSQQMVSKIESYNGNPSMLSFIKYCKSIGINLCELIK